MDDAQAKASMTGKGTPRRRALKLAASLRAWWRRALVDSVDQAEVITRVHDEARLSGRYLFMTMMAAGIAVLGLMQSSPAVVIGAMLLSPLMAPIIGSGFALAIGDIGWLKRCAGVLAVGTLVAVALSAAIVALSPLQSVTAEIAARTRPNLFDLGVAFFSALAGSYATIRGREGIIVGVAIATALVPPLAAAGFGLATLNVKVLGGAAMLFATNLMAISLASAAMARFYGFRTSLSKKQTRLQWLGIVVALGLLAVPLGLSLRQIAWESNAQRLAQSTLREQFGPRARVSQLVVDFDSRPVAVNAVVLTPAFVPSADAAAGRVLGQLLGAPVDVAIEQYRVGTEAGAVETAELTVARDREARESADRRVRELRGQLALVAGAAPDDVLVDRDHRRLVVRARAIEGPSLATYRALERRVQDGAPGWSVELVPPAGPLPAIPLTDGVADPAPIALIGWAATRVGAPLRLSGRPAALRAAARALREREVQALILAPGEGEVVTAQWAAPDALDTPLAPPAATDESAADRARPKPTTN